VLVFWKIVSVHYFQVTQYHFITRKHLVKQFVSNYLPWKRRCMYQRLQLEDTLLSFK